MAINGEVVKTGDTAFSNASAAFRHTYPAYDSTVALDTLRDREYARLDQQGHIYLDYTGAGLYGQSQIREFTSLLETSVLGNPHSVNPTSQAATRLVEQARQAVLSFFNAPADLYEVVFTANASAALKLVGEAFPFGPGSRYLLTYDNHNSVNGIRQFAWAKDADVTYIPIVAPDLRVVEDQLLAQLEVGELSQPRLFAYPAQSNFSGVQHPLEWISLAQSRGWQVLLDAAAFAPTNRLDLSRWQPDFISCSFYKMFGFPTGVGCLLARRSSLAQLRRPWFAGGTISIVSVQGRDWHYLLPNAPGFEDGTVNFLGLPGVEIGLRYLKQVGMDRIHERVRCLTGWLLASLQTLAHDNGSSLVRIYGPLNLRARGGTIAFNVLDPEGTPYSFRNVESLAAHAHISLRTGCFCNPGAGEVAHGLSADDMARCFAGEQRMSFDQFFALMQRESGKQPSTLRVSLGLVSNFADVYRFVSFVKRFANRSRADVLRTTVGSERQEHAPDTA